MVFRLIETDCSYSLKSPVERDSRQLKHQSSQAPKPVIRSTISNVFADAIFPGDFGRMRIYLKKLINSKLFVNSLQGCLRYQFHCHQQKE